LLGIRLRAFYQRKKGRDLFDLAVAITQGGVDPARIVKTFSAYMEHDGHIVTCALFKQNMQQKRTDPQFTADIGPLLASAYSWDFAAVTATVQAALIERLPGEPWRGGL
jgi:Nucleotidyl transferase AbiEii toxin, Type IV TA system